MSNVMSEQCSPRVLFFGMQGDFSSAVLTKLLAGDVEIGAIVIPAVPLPGSKPPAIQQRTLSRAMRLLPLARGAAPDSLMHIAWQKHIPVFEVYRLAHRETIETLSSLHADILCVACFSRLIPRSLLEIPRLGAINVHPSLLPANRGPVPLFWTLREGHETTGVTIHAMTEQMDNGDILAQQQIPVPEGILYDQLELLCATTGGSLLAKTIWDLYTGKSVRHVQDEAQSSYHSFPEESDFMVPVETWDARHVYNFIHGISTWGKPLKVLVKGQSFPVRNCISYSLNDVAKDFIRHNNGELLVACRTGWVRLLLQSPVQMLPSHL